MSDDKPSIEELVRARLIDRVEELLDDLKAGKARRTPQVRTVRNQVKATSSLLEFVGERLDVVYDLAYDRGKAAERLAVRGGDRDYALDTNGDPKARELYKAVSVDLANMLEVLTISAHEMASWLKDGEVDFRRRSGRTLTADEVLEVRAAGARRAERGEGTLPPDEQPAVKEPSRADLEAEVRTLEGIIGKVHPTLRYDPGSQHDERLHLTGGEVARHREAVDAHERRVASRALTVADLTSRREQLCAVLGKVHPRLKGAERSKLSALEQATHRRAVDAYRSRREAR